MPKKYYKYLMNCSLLIKCADCDMNGLCRECWRKEQRKKQHKQLFLLDVEEAEE